MHTPHLIAIDLIRQRQLDIHRGVRGAGLPSPGRARRRLVRRLIPPVARGRKLVHG